MSSVQYRGLNGAWYLQMKRFLEDSEESWFATFSFPFNIRRSVAEEKFKDWIRRLRQVLRLREEEVSCESVYAQQKREVLHIHALITAEGLSKLDRSRWENKWTEITGQKEVKTSTKIRTHRHPGVIRRRNGEETVVTSVTEYEKEVIDTEIRHKGAGTCRIKPVQKDGKGYTPEGVVGYIVARHSREVSSDIQFSGRANGIFT